MWQLIVTLWYSTSEGQGRDFTPNSIGGWQGKRISGHYERETIVQKGGIHGNYLNDERNLNIIDNIQIAEKWVWDNAPSYGGYTIEMNRIAESPSATVSEFTANGPIPLRPVSGYILEPGGPSTTARGKDRRVPTGTYNVAPYSSTNHPNVYRISNAQVPADRYILIHPGNYHSNTLGCFLPGSSYSMVNGNYAVWNSTATFNQLRGLFGTNDATLIIRDINPFNFNFGW